MTTVFFDLGDTLVFTQQRAWVAGAKELLRELRDKGYKLGVISNTGGLDRSRLASILPIDFDWAVFDASCIVLSDEVGSKKPEAGIFIEALKRAQGGPAVFCTEELEHSLAAQLAGLPCLRLTPPPGNEIESVSEVLAARGLAPAP